MGLGDRSHDGANREAVEVVVDEDQDAQEHGQQLRGRSALDLFLRPAAERFGTAALVHQVGDDAQFDQEDDDAHIPAVAQNGQKTVIRAYQRQDGFPGTELRIQQCSDDAAEEQGRVYFLADQGQSDGADRRKQRPERRSERSLIVFAYGSVRILHAQDGKQYDDAQYRYQIGSLGAFLFHKK